jgi:hypothetical protein
MRKPESWLAGVYSCALLSIAALASAGCVGVDLRKEGQQVEVREASQLSSACQKIGMVSARTLSRILFVRRSETKIASELATLARNQAGKLGGDTMVVSSPVVEGEQSFDVYRCTVS